MSKLSLVYAPNKIFKQKAEAVGVVDDSIRSIVDDMIHIMYSEGAVGIGANMVGLLKRIAVVDLRVDNIRNPYVLINPEIIWFSEEKQTCEEASLCFPGISAEITRPKSIMVRYLDPDGASQKLECEGFLATVVQHEVDYLNGVVFLDYLSKMKRDLLINKMQKHIKMHPPHVHGEHCSH
ncbi:MAG: peptide deformylase [Pseudomonadota bacterium]